MGSTAAELVVKIVTDTKGAARDVDATASRFDKFKGGVSAAAKGAGIALAGLTVAAVSFAKAAAEDEQSQAILAQTLKNTTGATSAQIKQTEAYISSMSAATGVADDELRPAMATLARASGDTAKAQKDLKVAMDIAAATGKPLQTVSEAIAKGYSGTTTSLGRLVPGIDKATLATKDFHKIFGAAAKMTAGSASAAANTAAGRYAKMQVAINETKESLGTALLPVMSKFATLAATVAGWAQKNTRAFQIIAGVIAGLAVTIIALNYALKAYTVISTISTALTKRDAEGKLVSKVATLASAAATGIATAAQWAWNAALSANPIGLVVIAIIALIAVFVILYKKSKTFRDFVQAMWKAVKSAATAVARAVSAAWQVAFAVVRGYVQAWLAYFKLALGVIKGVIKVVVAIFKGDWRGVFDAVRGIVSAFRDFFRSIFNALPEPVQKVITKIREGLGGAISWLRDKVSALGDVLAAPFVAMYDAVANVIDKVEALIGWLGKIKVPSLGGVLDKINPFSVVAPPAGGAAGGAGGAPRGGAGHRAGGSGRGGVQINVNGALDPESVARQIKRILAGHDRRVGLRTA